MNAILSNVVISLLVGSTMWRLNTHRTRRARRKAFELNFCNATEQNCRKLFKINANRRY
jgi:hypothetical protein